MDAASVRFAILGCGVIGKVHAGAIAALPDANLVAVADVGDADPAAKALADQFNVPAFGSLEALLESGSADVVNICTPSGLHAEHALRAMRAGCHVIVEKPMALVAAELDRMLEVEQESGAKLAVISQHRFDPDARRLHELIEDGALGRLALGVVQVPWWREQSYYDSARWRGTASMDGGVLMNQAIHSIDLLQWFMGMPLAVRAYASTVAHRMETEDVAAVSLRFGDGSLGSIASTTAAYPGGSTTVEILGDRGSARMVDDRLEYLRTESISLAETSLDKVPAFGNSHMAQIADLIEAIRYDRRPLVDGREGRKPVDVILAVLEAARTGREARVG